MYRPSPPVHQERYLYVSQNKLAALSWGPLSCLLLITGGIIFSVKISTAFLPFVIISGFYLLASYLIIFLGKEFKISDHFKVINKTPEKWPSVDVFLPSCGEDLGVIVNTLRAVRNIEYSGRLSVYVLNDSKDDTHSLALATYAQSFGFYYIERENKGYLKKSGNVRNAFAQTDGEFILILDADFAPSPYILNNTIPYLTNDPSIGILQTPQYFSIQKGMSNIHKGAAYVQELFYRLIQQCRDRWGAAICVGTSAIYRRKALVPYGGTAEMNYSEDAFTGLNTLMAGFKIKYLPVNLSKGACPDTPQAYIIQIYRWATGSITMFGMSKFWRSPLTKMQKLCYVTGQLYFITTGLGLFLCLIPSLVTAMFYPEKIALINSVFYLPSTFYGLVLIPLWSRNKWGTYAITARIMSYYSHFMALTDKITSSTVPWIPTGSVKPGGKLYDRFIKLFLIHFGISLFIFCVLIYRAKERAIDVAPGLLVSFINLISLILVAVEIVKQYRLDHPAKVQPLQDQSEYHPV